MPVLGRSLKTPYQIREMDAGATLLRQFFSELDTVMLPGATGHDVERSARRFLRHHNYRSLILGYQGFPSVVCVNRNGCAAHGVPDRTPFQDGDIVTVDLAISNGNFASDMAWTWLITPEMAAESVRRLVAIAWQTTLAAARASAGGLSAIAQAAAKAAAGSGCLIVPEFTGHGIGRRLHEAPKVAYHDGLILSADRSTGLTIGTVLAIEPVLVTALKGGLTVDTAIRRQANGWHLANGLMSAQFEVMVALEAGGPRILGFNGQTPPEKPQYKHHSGALSPRLSEP